MTESGAVLGAERDGATYLVTLRIPYPAYPFTEVLRSDIEWAGAQAGVGVKVKFAVGDAAWADGCLSRFKVSSPPGGPERIELPVAESGQPVRRAGDLAGIDALQRRGVRKIVAVASGKGGVGKSFVTASLATHLRLLGFNVGILDADITGPCISRMLGVTGLPRLKENKMMQPLETQLGTKVMAVDLIMDRFKTPLIWRGPLINSAIRGLFSETDWGDTHYLLVDLPPGTSDAPLTVFQSLRPDAVVFVTSPMLVAKTVVARAVTMAKELGTPILGVVENMSHMATPSGVRVNVFGRGGTEESVKDLGVSYLGSLPLDPAVSGLADRGEIEFYRSPELFGIARLVRFGLMRLGKPVEPAFWTPKSAAAGSGGGG